MTLIELDSKIKEIEIKLYGKKHVYEKSSIIGGKKKFIVSVHLRKYLLEELKKLEGLRESLMHPKLFNLKVDWSNIYFENKQISIKSGNIFTEKYYFEFSRSSFEILKPFIIAHKLKPLKVKICNNKIVSISNLEEVLNVFRILTLKNESFLYVNDHKSASFRKIILQLKDIDNKHILEFYRIIEHSEYLQFLCTMQSKEYKIIPATELIISNQKIISEDDAFLFTINTRTKMFIIWESVLINKATYIFKTNASNYFQDLQFIYDFIVSDNNKKRFKLGVLIKEKENRFNLVYKLIHSTKEEWISKIQNL